MLTLKKILDWKPRNLWGFPSVQQFRWFLAGLVLATSTLSFAAYTNFKPVLIVTAAYAGNYTPVLVVNSSGTPVSMPEDVASGADGECLLNVDSLSSEWATCPGAAEADTLDTVFDRGKTIDGANTVGNAVRIGDGTTPVCIYTDATLGPQVRPCTDADVKTVIPTNFNWCLYDIEATSCTLTVDPDGASTLAMWQVASAYRWKKSVWFGAGSLSTDGTQCAAPAEVTIASNPKIWTVICTENDGATMYANVKMPDNWDAGTVTVEGVFIQTAADTGTIKLDVGAQCRGNGEAVSTWGTEVDLDMTGTGSNKNDYVTSAAITPAGTCAASDMLYIRAQVDATSNPTTAAATLNFVGFKVEYSETGPSQ